MQTSSANYDAKLNFMRYIWKNISYMGLHQDNLLYIWFRILKESFKITIIFSCNSINFLNFLQVSKPFEKYIN